MSENRTATMLERLPRILAVTAGSYGLNAEAGEARGKQAAPRPHSQWC